MADPGLHETYDIEDTASYILKHGYKRVALQFPDQLLNISVAVTRALMDELRRQSKLDDAVQLYVLADTTYGSCCGDEIAAAHVNAECIVHYGHACLSQMSKLPVWHVFGRASIDVDDCVQQLLDLVSRRRQHVLVLYDLEYAYSIPSIQKNCEAHSESFGKDVLSFANVPERAINPGTNIPILQQDMQELKVNECEGQHVETSETLEEATRISNFSYNTGGIGWSLPRHCGMESVVVFWIGQEGPSLTNFMLTYNATAIVLYDPDRKVLLTDVTNQSKILRRRYYLVERAKDANIVGIVIGTLGVVGYRETVHKIKQFLKAAGKKSYILAMGKPNPAKLANFPECDIFVLVACAQTALLDSKDFMAPVITPFEAMLAWKRGSQWTGSYSLDFTAVRGQQDPELEQHDHKEARFSFIKGAYVEDNFQKPTDHETISSRALILARETEQALQLQSRQKSSEIVRTAEARSGVEYFAARSYHGLENDGAERPIQPHVMGRHGRASAYRDEMGDGAH